MHRAFYGSICHDGIQGGAILVDDDGIVFKCQKASIEPKYRNLLLHYEDIRELQPCRSLLVFPAVRIMMKNYEQYKFVVFNRTKFLRLVDEMREN